MWYKTQIYVLALIFCAGLEVFGQATQPGEISKCADNMFSEVLCEAPNSQVQLVDALYGDFSGWSCDEDMISPDDCRVHVVDYNPGYYNEIEAKCQGHSCEGLVAERQAGTSCFYISIRRTDYVTLIYRCTTTDLPTEASTTKHTTATLETTNNVTFGDSTTNINSSPDLEGTTRHIIEVTSLDTTTNVTFTGSVVTTSHTNPGIGVLVGVPVAVVIIAAIVVVLVLYMLRIKRAPKGRSSHLDNNDGVITNENVYTNPKSPTMEFTVSQDDATYENQHNAGPLVYSLATGSVRLTNSTRDETEMEMIVYDNDNYTPCPRTVNTEDISQIVERRDNEVNETILCDNVNYSSFAEGEHAQDVTIIQDNVNYAGYNSEPFQNNIGFHQTFNDEEDQTVLFDNQQYASTEEAVPTDKEGDTDIMAENLNYEAWDQ